MKAGSRRLADAVVVDHAAGSITIDGVELPWWVEVDPEVVHLENGLTSLRIGIQCEGVSIVIGPDGSPQAIDSVLGNVGDWATDRVLKSLRERLDWLTA